MLSAVIWDMDGVLVDSEQYWSDVEKEFARRHGIAWSAAYHAQIMARPERELAQFVKLQYGVPQSTDDLIMERRELATPIYASKTALMPGARELLVRLFDNNVTMALTSSSPWAWIGPVLDRFALHRFFPVIIGAEDLKGNLGKPAPDPYRITIETLEIPPEQAVALEDSLNGIASAKAAGIACVALKAPWVDVRAAKKAADLMVARLDEITIEMLEEILNTKS